MEGDIVDDQSDPASREVAPAIQRIQRSGAARKHGAIEGTHACIEGDPAFILPLELDDLSPHDLIKIPRPAYQNHPMPWSGTSAALTELRKKRHGHALFDRFRSLA